MEVQRALDAVHLTQVKYARGDAFGFFMAWMSLVPVFLCFACLPTLIVFRRNLTTVFLSVGLFCNDAINQVVKRIIRHPRPPMCELLEMCQSYGMPSAHTQCMCFFAAFVTLAAFDKARLASASTSHPLTLPNADVTSPKKTVKQSSANGNMDNSGRANQRLAFSQALYFFSSAFVCWPLAFFTGTSRVYLGYHSLGQVVAGGCLGTVLGSVWFYLVKAGLRPFFPVWSESGLGQWLYLRDDSHIADVMQFEYQNSTDLRHNMEAMASAKKCD